MRALVFEGKLRLREDYPVPVPASGEVRVRVRRAGICRTDLEITQGYMHHRGILGHEFVGELADGSRVVGEINAPDGTCAACQRGDVTHCEHRTVLGIVGRDGALVVDEITLVGSRCGPFEPALRLLEQRLVEVESLLDAEYPLARGIEAFIHAATPGALKVQVVMEQGTPGG